MGTKDPINIQRFVRQNERYSLAAAYSDKVQKTNIVCNWHEKAFQTTQRAVTLPDVPKKIDESLASQANLDQETEMVVELAMANRSVAMLRKAKLRELFKSEALQYEEELNALGKSVDRIMV